MAPALVSCRVVTVIDDLLHLRIKTHDLLTYARSSAVYLFVAEIEHFATG